MKCQKKCQKCGNREGTEIWCESGAFGWAHGMGQHWCKICVLEEQLEFARKAVERIPEMTKRLEELKKVE